jgi:ATP-binding cassette subfamily F protein 3
MLLLCRNICKSFGERGLLRDVSFTVDEKEKAAIVGVNGAGKTTLLKIISGAETADSGEVTLRDTSVGTLPQLSDITPDFTVYEEMLTVFSDVIALENDMRAVERRMADISGAELERAMARHAELSNMFEQKNGYEYKSRARGVIKGLGFVGEESEQPIGTFSGGQKTRVAMAKLLLTNPKLLLLDEPTNHLDMESVAWLEDYLKSYAGSVVVVSHDRFFMDKIVTKVIEIENGKCGVFSGDYTAYAAKKRTSRDIALKHYETQRREIRRREETIRLLKSYNREKSVKRAESREKALKKIELLEKPAYMDEIRFEFLADRESGNDVLFIRGLAKSFGETPLFENVSFELKKGDKAALIGANGIGKTTLLKIVAGRMPAGGGEIRKGVNVTIGFAEQNTETERSAKTVIEEMSDTFPKLELGRLRDALAAFLFVGDDVFKELAALSGGELGRLALLKVMLSGANFLILDEPTNHLDAPSAEVLENALREYDGTLLYVSHDRYFINKTATKIIELAPKGVIVVEGDYNYYVDKKREAVLALPTTNADASQKPPGNPKKESAIETRKRRAALLKAERDIETAEKRAAEIDEKMALPEIAADHAAVMELYDEKQCLDESIAALYKQWEGLADG